ncbi:uncharacterized protein LOC114295977 [Camellia sinensis]|uniref:uncharacterized protein LOC114295977 n=1 Tax=Camellia sinensis TaxID=4442 RepID=UPI00103556CC|nr:uncharacterized protein LOC114295977 [Camellia sinensis]
MTAAIGKDHQKLRRRGMMELAAESFAKAAMEDLRERKKHFTFDTCWDILRRSCKWDEFRTQSKKSTQHAYPCSNPPTGESDAFQSNQNNVLHEEPSNPSTRPIGTKAAKQKLKNQITHDSRFDEMAANQSKLVEVLSTISARTIERDEQKAIDRNQKAADR